MTDLTPAEVRAEGRRLAEAVGLWRTRGDLERLAYFVLDHRDVLMADPEPPTPTDEDAQEAGGVAALANEAVDRKEATDD